MNRIAWIAIAGSLAAPFAAGCKSDMGQQLLERELRMQEDQIYLLQDELQEKCARLDRVAYENKSLKKQLGIVDPDASLPSRVSVPPGVAAPARAPTAAPPAAVPPSIAIPGLGAPAIAPPTTLPETSGVPPVGSGGTGAEAGDGPRFAPGGAAPPPVAPPAIIMPPKLDGVPPLPGERGAAAPAIKRLSHEESLSAEGRINHLVINPTRTECYDGNGDGTSDGLAVVFEPRDADERLVTAAGDVVIAAFDPALPADGAEGGCIATWEISSAEAIAHFRRTSRARGLHFTLPWQGRPPAGDHVRLVVRLTTFEGESFATEATVPVR